MKNLLKIQKQGGKCDGIYCPNCALMLKCFTTPTLKTEEEVLARRLIWIKELIDEKIERRR